VHPPDASTTPPSAAPDAGALDLMEELVEQPPASNNGRRD
jgi:hypothetical protein